MGVKILRVYINIYDQIILLVIVICVLQCFN